MSSIGNRIKELLNKHDISQKDLARYIGTTEASISRYVNDEREPVAKVLYKIAQELHTTTDYLISGTGDNYEELYWMELDRADSYARKYNIQIKLEKYLKTEISILEKMIEIIKLDYLNMQGMCPMINEEKNIEHCRNTECQDCIMDNIKSQAKKEVEDEKKSR